VWPSTDLQTTIMFGLAVSLGPIMFACIWHWIKKKQEWKFPWETSQVSFV
jgi:hypothetical protein